MRSAGLILPPVLRCSSSILSAARSAFASCARCRSRTSLRVGEGQAPACYMRVGDFLINPPSPPTLRRPTIGWMTSCRPACVSTATAPKGRYLALGACQDPAIFCARCGRRPSSSLSLSLSAVCWCRKPATSSSACVATMPAASVRRARSISTCSESASMTPRSCIVDSWSRIRRWMSSRCFLSQGP